jgi:hypothetical protein
VRLARNLSLASVVVAAVVAVTTVSGCASAPRGVPGEKADAFATRIEEATGQAAWKNLGVVSFNFRGSRDWLWDRARGLVRMTDDDGTVFIDTWDHGGYAVDKDGKDVADAGRQTKAWAYFINDTFWLNPFSTLRNDGASRELADVDGATALVLHYESGGTTPGDTYVFFADDKGLPTRWKLWVSVLPIKGFETTFEGWADVGGAKLAASHKALGTDVSTAPLRGGATLKDAGVDEDPFARLLARRH